MKQFIVPKNRVNCILFVLYFLVQMLEMGLNLKFEMSSPLSYTIIGWGSAGSYLGFVDSAVQGIVLLIIQKAEVQSAECSCKETNKNRAGFRIYATPNKFKHKNQFKG